MNESFEVQPPRGQVFRYWSDLENFPNPRGTSRRSAHRRRHDPLEGQGTLGKSVEFEARTTEKFPDRGIGWNTVDGEVMISGEVRFEETASGRTRVEVTMNYSDPPGGKIGEEVAGILADPQESLREDLRSFERIVEQGDL